MARTAIKLPELTLPEAATKLVDLQRQRAIVIKTRVMLTNRIVAVVAGCDGYSTSQTDAERKARFEKAAQTVKGIVDGTIKEHKLKDVVKVSQIGLDAFDDQQLAIEKQMVGVYRRLPDRVKEWVEDPARRCLSAKFFCVLVGECGDLNVYSNPAKVWKRMGCAPWKFQEETLMGATWKSRSKSKTELRLPSEEWEKFGYSPRRRSISYLLGENIVKQNAEWEKTPAGETGEEATKTMTWCGPYRRRYDEVKVTAAEKHPDWKPLRVHRHAMLLATKKLLKDMWLMWTNTPEQVWQPSEVASPETAVVA